MAIVMHPSAEVMAEATLGKLYECSTIWALDVENGASTVANGIQLRGALEVVWKRLGRWNV
jgi:hypothetical protein